MYAVRPPTYFVQLSHAVMPGLPRGALSMNTPLAIPSVDGEMTAEGVS